MMIYKIFPILLCCLTSCESSSTTSTTQQTEQQQAFARPSVEIVPNRYNVAFLIMDGVYNTELTAPRRTRMASNSIAVNTKTKDKKGGRFGRHNSD